MKTFYRILSYGSTYRWLTFPYLLFSILSVLLSVTNLILLGPLFSIIFDTLTPEEIASYSAIKPFSFQLSEFADYFKSLFYHYFTDFMDNNGKKGALVFVCILLILSNLLSNFFKYLCTVIIAYVRLKLVKNVRLTAYKKVVESPLDFFINHPKGDIMSRLLNDVSTLEITIMYSFQVLLKEPLSVIIHIIFLMSMSVKLTLFSVVVLPISAILISQLAKKLKKNTADMQQSIGNLMSFLSESLNGIRIVKAFVAEKYVSKKMQNIQDYLVNISFKYSKKLELASPISETLGVLFICFILLYGGILVLDKQLLNPESFLVYLLIFAKLLEPAKEINKAYSGIQVGITAANRVFELIDKENPLYEAVKPVQMKDLKDKITINIQAFSYLKDNHTLKNIKIDLPKGKTYALVGPSGGGKSTLVSLIPRFYDVNEGGIFWDGTNIKDFKKNDLRNHIGIVTQETIVFSDTIYKNIAFAKEDTPMEDVIKAAKIANAHEFIMKLPDGYQTNIGEEGNKLSGGQKQRISIARAVLKNPSVLLLDEATSALDTKSEKLVQEALDNLLTNRTALIIAHRLSTIKKADKIIVIQEGEIKEEGTHENLVNLEDGIYKNLADMQSMNTE